MLSICTGAPVGYGPSNLPAARPLSTRGLRGSRQVQRLPRGRREKLEQHAVVVTHMERPGFEPSVVDDVTDEEGALGAQTRQQRVEGAVADPGARLSDAQARGTRRAAVGWRRR